MENFFHMTFVSQKISKIRWKREPSLDSEHFVTGSSEEEINKLSLWFYPLLDDGSEDYPRLEKALSVSGDVTEIQFIQSDVFVSSSSEGFVKVVRCSPVDFNDIHTWDGLHFYSTGETSSCSGLSCFEEDIATVGEDGRIVLLTLNNEKPLRTIDNADSCPLRCVCFLKHNELLTGNLRGQMKIWDLRSAADRPLSTFMLSIDQISTTCVTHHPTQSHILLAGAEDGSISVWDLRKSTYPVNVLNAHKNSVNEIAFHPERPDHLFTCSFSGDLWHWNSKRDFTQDDATWLSSDASSHRMDIISLMPPVGKPINSLDVNRTRLLGGSDNEGVYIIKQLEL